MCVMIKVMLFLDLNSITLQRLVGKPGPLVTSTRFLGVHITNNPLNLIYDPQSNKHI